MGTSTRRPKPKPGQSAGKNATTGQNGSQPTAGAPQPKAKTTTGAVDSTAKTTTSGTLPTPSKTPTAKAPTSPTSAKAVSKAPPAATKPQPAQPPMTRRAQQQLARREEISRKIEDRRLHREREQRKQSVKKWAIIGIPSAIGIVLIGILLYNLVLGPQVAPYLRGATIDGISCDALEQTQTHYHAHLDVYINGAQVPIPSDVGRQSVTGCFYWLHVHSDTGDDGVIHIESPDSRTFSLKQFFDVWGQQLSATSVLGHKVDATHKLTVYVYNPDTQPTDSTQPFTVTPPSNLTPYTGDPTQITLKSHELIFVEYGAVVAPSPWSFLASE
jgi:hypothetical protein